MITRVKKYLMESGIDSASNNIIVGLSGGADSVCLLCVLAKLIDKGRLLAVHINHGIRQTASRDESFSKELCAKLDVSFESVHVDATGYAREHSMSTEEAGRVLRYEAFANVAIKHGIDNYVIAIAHNMDDNAETMLFNLFRGTGIKGIGGIRSSRDNIIRPLINIKRADIEEYLFEIEQDYCTDETNLSDDYSRNVIRHHIIPVAVKEVNEKAVERMSAFAGEARLINDYFEDKVERLAGEAVVVNNGTYLILYESVAGQHEYIKQRLVLEVLGKVAGTKKDITAKHVGDVLSLFEMQTGKSLDLPYNMKAKRQYEGVALFICNDELSKEDVREVKLIEEGTISLKGASFTSRFVNKNIDEISPQEYTKCIDYDKIQNSLVVRTRREGDYIVINDSGDSKKLKSYFIDKKIPSSERDKVLLVADGSSIVWIVGYRLSGAYKITGKTKRVIEIKCDVGGEANG